MHRLMGNSPGRHLTRGFLVAALVAAGLAATGSSASAANVAVDLCAEEGTIDLPGATGVPIWGFGIASTPGDCTTATPSLPGPVIEADKGDTVTLTVENALSAGHTLHLDIPGIGLDPGPLEADSGAAVTVTFTATNPGTYLYQSSGDAGRQTAMGLYGALLVRSATDHQAYDDPTTAYDVESVLVLSALDPDFNANPDSADLNDYNATYWMINGKSYPDTLPGITVPAGQRLLLRYLNAGFDNTTMALLGTHEHVVARDAHQVPTPFDAAAETIPAGATEDAIMTMPAAAPPVPAGFALFNRQLHLTNGPTTGPPPATTPAPGGMLTFIHP
jgi:FtsP/CotA-like multicopper oxidase with cupredoxin domain